MFTCIICLLDEFNIIIIFLCILPVAGCLPYYSLQTKQTQTHNRRNKVHVLHVPSHHKIRIWNENRNRTKRYLTKVLPDVHLLCEKRCIIRARAKHVRVKERPHAHIRRSIFFFYCEDSFVVVFCVRAVIVEHIRAGFSIIRKKKNSIW